MNMKISLIAKIHVAKSKLNMAEDDYRAMLSRHGAASSKDMSIPQLEAVMQEMQAKGFVPSIPRKAGKAPKVTPNKEALISKIEALLTAKAKRQGRPVPWSYAEAVAKRVCKVDKIAWCTPEQIGKVIAALSYDQAREIKAMKAKKELDTSEVQHGQEG